MKKILRDIYYYLNYLFNTDEYWSNVSKNVKLESYELDRYKERLDWDYISTQQALLPEDLEKFRNYVSWKDISKSQKLSLTQLDKYKFYLDWELISVYQKLSTEHFFCFKDYLCLYWHNIIRYQNLNSKDLELFKDKLNWNMVSKYQKLSSEDLEKYKNLININVQKKHHKEKNIDKKKREMVAYAKKYNLRFDGHFLYAFREHDQWGRGVWNKTIIYKRGIYYRDWRVDMDGRNPASFGLGICPKGNTPVKVSVQDWGMEVFSGVKCRVFGFTVL